MLTKTSQREGSVINSIPILFHTFDDLDIAVQVTVEQVQKLVSLFDDTAKSLLDEVAASKSVDALRMVIELMKTINTGNLEWR